MKYLIFILFFISCNESDCRVDGNIEREYLYYIEGSWDLEGGKHWDSLVVVPTTGYAYHGWINAYSTTTTAETHNIYNWVNKNNICLGFPENDVDIIYTFTRIPDGFTIHRDTTFKWLATR